MESPPSSSGRSRAPVVVALLASALGLAAAGAWWWSTRPDDVAPVVEPDRPPSTRTEVRLEATAPGAARVLVDGQALGDVTREPDGRFHGEALGRLAFQTRRLIGREVVVVRGEGVEAELALGIQRLLTKGGVVAPLVEPEPDAPR